MSKYFPSKPVYGEAFTNDSLDQAKLAEAIRVSSYIQKRLDLRGKPMFTFNNVREENNDCAYSIESTFDGYILGIHTIDADEFVCDGSPLDLDAASRFTSFDSPTGEHYTILPPQLYDGICSFIPGQDRLAISFFLTVDRNGSLINFSADKSVVRASLDCLFSEVDALYSSSDRSVVLPLKEKYAGIKHALDDFYALGAALYARRLAEGAAQFISVETVCERNADGEIAGMRRIQGFDAKMLLREFIIFSGIAIGASFRNAGIPCLYTCRDAIPPEKLRYLAEISGFEDYDENAPLETTQAELSKHFADSPYYDLLNAEFCKCLPPIHYSTLPGRNSTFYCDSYVRFLHPVLVYPDLLIQRLIKQAIDAGFKQSNLNVSHIKRMLSTHLSDYNSKHTEVNAFRKALIDECQSTILRPGAIFNVNYIGNGRVLLPWGLEGVLENDSDYPMLKPLTVKVVNPDKKTFCST